MASIEKQINRAADIAFNKLEKVNYNFSKIPVPVATFVRVYSAQGEIDNGGLEHFFESDWPNKPNYKVFIDSYNKIGSIEGAYILQEAVDCFPFDSPHRNIEARNLFMNQCRIPEEFPAEEFSEEDFPLSDFPIEDWDDILCGDEEVWEKLANYVEKHRAIFDNI